MSLGIKDLKGSRDARLMSEFSKSLDATMKLSKVVLYLYGISIRINVTLSL